MELFDDLVVFIGGLLMMICLYVSVRKHKKRTGKEGWLSSFDLFEYNKAEARWLLCIPIIFTIIIILLKYVAF